MDKNYIIIFNSNKIRNYIIGSYNIYSNALSKMLQSAKHYEDALKNKCYKVITYTWEDNILIREEYDMGSSRYSEDLYGKFEIKMIEE